MFKSKQEAMDEPTPSCLSSLVCSSLASSVSCFICLLAGEQPLRLASKLSQLSQDDDGGTQADRIAVVVSHDPALDCLLDAELAVLVSLIDALHENDTVMILLKKGNSPIDSKRPMMIS